MSALLLAFLLFYKLGEGGISDWDEARHGVSAYEMLKNNEWIATTYGYAMDYYNLKPPLSEWLCALGYALFGFTPFGLRISSAAAMFLTVLFCAFFAYRHNGRWSVFFVFLGFSGCYPLLFSHCARTADPDSLYILFHTISILALCEYYKKGDGYLYISCLSFSLAFLVKSWHAGCIGILVLLCLFLSKRIRKFTIKNWILCILFSAGPILLWAVARMTRDGMVFFKEMVRYDLFARTTTVLEEHVGGMNFYVRYLFESDISFPLIILSAFALPLLANKEKKAEIGTLGLAVMVPLLIFTLAATKIRWYILCIFPPLILLSAFGADELAKRIKNRWARYACLLLSLCTLFWCIGINIRTVWDIDSDGYLTSALFSMVSRTEDFSEKHIYKNTQEGETTWSQSAFLAAELAGDLLPQTGGLEGWYTDEQAYLLTVPDLLPELEANYELVAQEDDYCMIAHA